MSNVKTLNIVYSRGCHLIIDGEIDYRMTPPPSNDLTKIYECHIVKGKVVSIDLIFSRLPGEDAGEFCEGFYMDHTLFPDDDEFRETCEEYGLKY